jgi:PAS domain S-box-containing protein
MQDERKRATVLFRLAASLSLLIGAVSNASGERLPIKAYTIENGLVHNRVKRIVQDSRGFLWFCTGGGLSRFDGSQFVTYSVDDGLPAPSLNDIVEAGDGVYWVATNSVGVVRFDLTSGNSSPPAPNRSRFALYSVSSEPVTNRVNVLFRDGSGMLWAGTDGGLFRLDERAGAKTFEPVSLGITSHPDIQVQVWALSSDPAGDLWIGTKFGLLRRKPDGRLTHYAIAPSSNDDNVTAVIVDARGNLWLGHRTGLITFNPASASTEDHQPTVARALPADARRYTTADGMDSDNVLAVFQSADRRLWIRTFGRSLTEFDGRRFRSYAVGDHVGEIVGALTEDREGNLWLGSRAMGALKILRQGWSTYDEADGLGESVASVFENRDGELYINSSGWRISRFDGQRFTTVRPAFPATLTTSGWRTVTGMLVDHTGQWWFATREGLYRFGKVARFEQLAGAQPIAIYRARDGLVDDDVTRLFEDSRGDIWIASWVPAREVLVRWDRATGTFHRYGEKDGLRPFVTGLSFAEDTSGNVWIGFREGGLARYRNGRFTIITAAAGVGTGSVNGLYADQTGRVWAAVNGRGVWRIDDPSADPPRVARYTKAEGLTTDSVLSLTGDLRGRIYITGPRGIDRLEPASGRITHYSTADGLAGGEFTSATHDRSGALWFCTTSGLSRLTPTGEERVWPPPIRIGALRVAGIAQPLSPLGEAQMSPLRLKPSQNNIQIDFFALAFRAGETLRYQYRLEGASADWSAPAAPRSVDFASLSPGTYRFLVRAVTTAGIESPSPATVTFEILPPIWQRWWFLTITATIGAAAVVAFTRSRYRRVATLRESEERFRTLAETASDAIITIDDAGRIVLVNHAVEKVFGYGREELLGAELTMLMPASVRPRHQEGFARYQRTGERTIGWETIAVPGRHKRGHEIPLEISFGEFIRNNRRFFTGIARDVTERKRAEEALRRNREERLAELERVRKRIATDLHDDVGSSLTRISLLSEVVRRQVREADGSVVDALSSIAALSRELVDSMSDIVWAINPSKDHLSDLAQRMRHFVSDLCTAREIQLRFRTPPPECDIAVGANVRREVFLLFKEAVNNLVRHSRCSEAELEFSINPGGLVLRVSDNGHGFNLAAASDGHGLRSMRERTEALGGTLEVVSQPGRGTLLVFTILLADRVGTPADQAPATDTETAPYINMR